MVAPTNLNLQNLRGKAFKGFVQFQIPDGSTWYRMKERQTMSLNMAFPRSQHYSDDGQLALDPNGISHSFSMTIKTTSDMWDTVFSDASDKKTLSYWIYKNTIYDPIEIIFVASFENHEDTSPPFSTENKVNIKFVLDPSTFSTGLSTNGGSPDVTIGGTIRSITSALRSTTNEQ